jgi:hypothetical protein
MSRPPAMSPAGTSTARIAAAARLIVCERAGAWAVELRRELDDTGVRVWETRNLDDCWAMLAETPGAMLIVELTEPGLTRLLPRMTALPRQFPMARIAIVAPRELRGYEPLMREAGAVHFVVSPRQTAALAQLALRHLASVPLPLRSMAERIWDGLPWS